MQNETEPLVFETIIDGTPTTVTLNSGQSVKYTGSYNSPRVHDKWMTTFTRQGDLVQRLHQSIRSTNEGFDAFELEQVCSVQELRDQICPDSAHWRPVCSPTRIIVDIEDAIHMNIF